MTSFFAHAFYWRTREERREREVGCIWRDHPTSSCLFVTWCHEHLQPWWWMHTSRKVARLILSLFRSRKQMANLPEDYSLTYYTAFSSTNRSFSLWFCAVSWGICCTRLAAVHLPSLIFQIKPEIPIPFKYRPCTVLVSSVIVGGKTIFIRLSVKNKSALKSLIFCWMSRIKEIYDSSE